MSTEKRWILPEKIHLPEAFKSFIGEEPLVAEILFHRGIRTIEDARAFLDPAAFNPCPPDALPDSLAALELLKSALTDQKRILVWGDFDVDGQTATTLLVEALQGLGGKVSFHIPVHGEESHGINENILASYLKQGFDLLLTCDTGISEHENVLRVRQTGIPVIITDHHTLGKSLPPANAVVNPQRLEPGHPLRSLPGVGVAYMLMEGLYQRLEKPFDTGHYMELAALGIVADVADLYQDTRYLLQKGIASLRQTRRAGLQTLYWHSDLNPALLNESHIGFQIAPRLNAVGRLADANTMVEFLATQDPDRARVLATEIEALNAQRRFATRQVEKAAETRLAASADDRHAPAILLHHPEWPGGVVGIVASRLVERYQKPAILLTGTNPLHGSARSIPGLNITKAIASQAGLLAGFGGHPMAAGLSLPEENFTAFKYGFMAFVQEKLNGLQAVPEIQVDREITLDQITFELIEQVERLAPFGPGNPALKFLVRNLELVSSTVLGAQGEHRQVIAADPQENTQRFIWWNGGDAPLPEGQFDLVCTLSQSDYKGQRQISAEWIDFRITQQGRQQIARDTIEVIDKRSLPAHEDVLNHVLKQEPGVQIWAEGPLPDGFPGKSRHDLSPCESLVIWTAPPSLSVLDDVLRRTHPQQAIVFGRIPPLRTKKALMERLAGLAKYAMHHTGGVVQLTQLASACAVEIETILIGLKLWEAMGQLRMEQDGDRVIIIQTREENDLSSVKIYQEILQSLLNEISVYRQYFNKVPLKSLFIDRKT